MDYINVSPITVWWREIKGVGNSGKDEAVTWGDGTGRDSYGGEFEGDDVGEGEASEAVIGCG